jgi:hypothetical protein
VQLLTRVVCACASLRPSRPSAVTGSCSSHPHGRWQLQQLQILVGMLTALPIRSLAPGYGLHAPLLPAFACNVWFVRPPGRCFASSKQTHAIGGTQQCVAHGGGMRCQEEDCLKLSSRRRYRCLFTWVDRNAVDYRTTCTGLQDYLYMFVSLKSCLKKITKEHVDRPQSLALHPKGDTGACAAHVGGRRYQHLGCLKGAASGETSACIAHGGGR